MGPARPKIKLYTLSTCSHCNRTKRFFKDCGIDVEFTDVDLLNGNERAAILDEVRKLNPIAVFRRSASAISLLSASTKKS